MSNPDRKTYVLYHDNCADGFGSAWVASLVLGERDAIYLPVLYGRPMPEIPEDSDVYILDFSYSAPELRALAARVHVLVIIDHHATAKSELEALGKADPAPPANVRVVFDTARSGAALTWREFFPEDPMPELVRFIEDRDLWRWQIPDSRFVSAGLASYPFDFARWNELAKDIPRLAAEGRVALRMIDEQARRAAQASVPQAIGGYTVPTVNATSYVSETCHCMLDLNPKAQFVAAYRDEPGRRVWSLRSRPDFDCSQVAKHHGGGGHPQACGFEERLSSGAVRIARERARHFKDGGWSSQIDDTLKDGSLSEAAACYISAAAEIVFHGLKELPANFESAEWPWHVADWKPSKDPVRNLEMGGAMVAAEIDRLERLAAQSAGGVA